MMETMITSLTQPVLEVNDAANPMDGADAVMLSGTATGN
jgi:pyruvate kinase